MANLSLDAQTRVDQFRADLARLQDAQRYTLAPVASGPMFVTHPDGAVYNGKGVEIRPATSSTR